MKPQTFLSMIVLFLSFFANAQKDSIQFRRIVHPSGLDSVYKEGERQHKLVFIDCYMVPCGPCRWMDARMFSIDSVARFYSDYFICIKIDMSYSNDPSWMNALEVYEFPSYLIKNSDGRLVAKTIGACKDSAGNADARRFISFGRNAIADNAAYLRYDSAWSAGSSSQSDLIHYMQLRQQRMQPCDEILDTLIARHGDPYDSLSWNMFRMYASPYGASCQFVVLHCDSFRNRYTADTVDAVLETKYRATMLACLNAHPMDTIGYSRLRDALDCLHAGHRLALELDMELYRIQRKWSEYTRTAYALAPYVDSSDFNWFNNTACRICLYYNDSNALDLAYNWSLQAITVHPSYNTMDTYARILQKQGKNGEALHAAQCAVELAKEYNAAHPNQVDYSNEEKFIETLKK